MNFEYSEKVQGLIKRVNDFMDLHVFPVEEEMHKQVELEPWSTPPLMEQLKAKAKAEAKAICTDRSEEGSKEVNVQAEVKSKISKDDRDGRRMPVPSWRKA